MISNNGNFELCFRVNLNKMNSARKTLSDIGVSVERIGRRWGSGKAVIYEPIQNFLDVNYYDS
jgi:hypothetical protein